MCQSFGDERYSELELFGKAGVSLKIVAFSMETPCVEERRRDACNMHGGWKPVETSEVFFGSLKTLILSVKLENICDGTSLGILAT